LRGLVVTVSLSSLLSSAPVLPSPSQVASAGGVVGFLRPGAARSGGGWRFVAVFAPRAASLAPALLGLSSGAVLPAVSAGAAARAASACAAFWSARLPVGCGGVALRCSGRGFTASVPVSLS